MSLATTVSCVPRISFSVLGVEIGTCLEVGCAGQVKPTETCLALVNLAVYNMLYGHIRIHVYVYACTCTCLFISFTRVDVNVCVFKRLYKHVSLYHICLPIPSGGSTLRSF